MNSIRITVKTAPGTTAEEARELRAHALRYVLDRYFEKQKAAGTSGGEDARKETSNDSDKFILP